MKIARNISTRFLFPTALFLMANDAAAQAPAQSFADLQSLIKPGQQVTVWTDDDRRITGSLTSLTGNQLEIRRPRLFRLPEPVTLTEGSVRRIVHEDSDWNGSLIGGGVGTLITILFKDKCGEYAVFCDYVIILSPAAGLLVGGMIDSAITRTLYLSPGGTRVTLYPVLGRERAGLAAAIRF